MLRIVGKAARLAADLFYLAITLASAALCAWSFVMPRRMKGPAPRT